MTAWIAIVAPTWIVAKCAVDFIALEYGYEHRPFHDDILLMASCSTCAIAIVVDGVNFLLTFRRKW